MGAEHLIYCPMFLRCTFHDAGREILRHILRRLGVCRWCPIGFPVKGSERRVMGAVPLSSAGFRRVKEASGVSLLGTRKRAAPRIWGGFSVRELWEEEG